MNPLQNPPERKKYLFHFLGFDFDLTRLSLKDLFWWKNPEAIEIFGTKEENTIW